MEKINKYIILRYTEIDGNLSRLLNPDLCLFDTIEDAKERVVAFKANDQKDMDLSSAGWDKYELAKQRKYRITELKYHVESPKIETIEPNTYADGEEKPTKKPKSKPKKSKFKSKNKEVKFGSDIIELDYHYPPKIVNQLELLSGGFKMGLTNKAYFRGKSGVGKTLLGEQIAAHFGMKFNYISAASFQDKFYGNTQKAVSEFFENKGLLFIDEVDGIGKDRAINASSLDNSAVTTLLTNLDNLNPKTQIVIIATNMKHQLDRALTRRFGIEIDFNCYTYEDYEIIIDNKVKEYYTTRKYKNKGKVFKKTIKNLKERVKKNIEIWNPAVFDEVIRQIIIRESQNKETTEIIDAMEQGLEIRDGISKKYGSH